MKKLIYLILFTVVFSFSLHAQSPYGKVLTLDNNGAQQWIDIGTVLSTYTTYHTGNSSPSWLTNGNAITTGVFLGTTNNEPLTFKTNGVEHMRLLENGGLRLYTSTGTNNITFQYSGSTNLTFNLPTSYGTSGQFLTTDGSGNLSWASASFTETDPVWSSAKSGTTTISGNWTFSNTITGSINGNAGTVTNGLYTTTNFANTGASDATVSGPYNSLNIQLSSGVVGATELANDAVTTAKIADGTIQNADISNSAGIAVSKLAPGSNGQVLQTVSGTPQWTTFSSSGWGLTGNAGTNPSTNFIGTTDAAALQIKVNNQKSGRIDYTNPYNTAWGYQALNSNTTGSYNTASGYQALYYNTTANGNTAIGYQALNSNTTANGNTASGYQALYTNTIGNFNTASGTGALYSNTGGYSNTASGYLVLFYNTTGDNNTASGYEALYSNTAGNNNTAVGYMAGYNITTGNNNIFIGYNAQPSSATVSNEVTIGNSSNNSYRMYAASWTNASDARYKHDIEQLPFGLDFILQLKPRQYVYNNSTDGKITMGFVAQEVQEVMRQFGMVDKFNLVKPLEKDFLGLNTTEIIPILVKAVQEQQQRIEKMRTENEQMQVQNEQMQAQNEQMRAQNEKMRAENDALKQRLERLEKYVFERTGSGDNNVGMK